MVIFLLGEAHHYLNALIILSASLFVFCKSGKLVGTS